MSATSPAKVYPALFVAHGGGPMPLLGDAGHEDLVRGWRSHVKDILARHGPPAAIAVVSAHYQTAAPEVGGCAAPAMYYDYGGFPKEAYALQYPAPGAPELAQRMVSAMQRAGLHASVNPTRRYDHGVFVPLMIMFASAGIPVVPVSVLASNDPAEHLRMGQALRPFREEGVFFIGSGLSMHHFGRFHIRGAGTRFGDSLTAVLQGDGLTPEQRLQRMAAVKSFDGFDDAQPPRDHEHLVPLLTIAGTANGAPAREVANVRLFAANVREYLFEE